MAGPESESTNLPSWSYINLSGVDGQSIGHLGTGLIGTANFPIAEKTDSSLFQEWMTTLALASLEGGERYSGLLELKDLMPGTSYQTR